MSWYNWNIVQSAVKHYKNGIDDYDIILIYMLQMDMTAEEKRQKHQHELRERLKEEALERLKGMKTGKEDKKWVKLLPLNTKSGIVSNILCCISFIMSLFLFSYL